MKSKEINVSALQEKEQHRKTRTKAMTEELVTTNMEMIRAVSGTISSAGRLPPGMTYDDLVSYGVEGLIKAWQSFDARRGILFKTYASYRVRGEILDTIRREWRYRNPTGYTKIYEKIEAKIGQLAADMGEDESTILKGADPVQDVVANSAVVYLLSLDTLTNVSNETIGVVDSAERIVSEIEFARERAILWEEVKNLDPDEKKIVHFFYIENKKQNEISDLIGLSKSKVSRLHVKLIEKLRRRLKRRMVP
jgi:RNA polymerase sigma factor for flagellar operon FliA